MRKISNAQKQQVISKYIQSAEGRRRLAASMIQPLRVRRDYTSVLRKAFLVEDLPDGALPIYDRDPDVTAFVIGEEGHNVLNYIKPLRVLFPLFEIASNPSIPITQLKERRYDLLERSQDLAKAEIQAEEDTRGFSILDAVATDPNAPNPDIPVAAPVTPDVLADSFADIERHDLRVARIFMNAKDYTDVRKFGRDILDVESQASLLATGLMANLWGAKIIVSRIVPVGQVYVLAEPEYVGRIPVRTELTVMSADVPQERTVGFSIFQHLGIGAHNPRAVSRLIVTRL